MSNKYKYFLSSKNNLFILTFVISVITYITYLTFRGFGWDGDSFISASQFVKIINRDLYRSAIDGGAHPKFLTVILFGSIYQVTGGFYVLTFISIIFNALMVGTIVKWVNKENGWWLVAFFGLLINIPWAKLVINCDNPAFSIPLIIFGLYFISQDKIPQGAFFLIISNLFRSGSEFIIVLLIVHSFFSKEYRNIGILGIALLLTLAHSYWGYLLVYPSKEIFWDNTWVIRVSPETIAKYQYSLNALVPYLKSVITQLLTKYSILFIIPGIIGIYRIFNKKLAITLAIFIPLDSLILPVSSFIYGTSLLILETKHMGFTIMLPIMASFAINKNLLNRIGGKLSLGLLIVTCTILIVFSGITGKVKSGDYESHTNGSGVIGWTNYPDIKQDVKLAFPSENINILTAYQYLTFTILDIGKYANNIDIIWEVTEIDYVTINKYDLVVLPKTWGIDSTKISNLGYGIKFDDGNPYQYFISRSTLPKN